MIWEVSEDVEHNGEKQSFKRGGLTKCVSNWLQFVNRSSQTHPAMHISYLKTKDAQWRCVTGWIKLFGGKDWFWIVWALKGLFANPPPSHLLPTPRVTADYSSFSRMQFVVHLQLISVSNICTWQDSIRCQIPFPQDIFLNKNFLDALSFLEETFVTDWLTELLNCLNCFILFTAIGSNTISSNCAQCWSFVVWRI